MSEMKNDISKGNIRTQMNLIFAMMRLLATILDIAIDSQTACNTLEATAEGILEQAAILFRDKLGLERDRHAVLYLGFVFMAFLQG